MLRRAVVTVLACTALTACSAGDEPSAARSQQPSPSPAPRVTVTGCPELQQALEDPEAQRGGIVEGSFSGQGPTEGARIVVAEDGEPGCRAFLLVDGADQGWAIALGTAELPVELSVVRIEGVADIDERPGAEVIVHELVGASTAFVAVYSLGSGEIERLRIEAGRYGDLFPTGGSVGHLEASDCLGPQGEVVVSLAEPQGAGYRVTRSFFTTEDGSFVVSGDEQVRIRDPQDLEQFQEFNASPFGTCANP